MKRRNFLRNTVVAGMLPQLAELPAGSLQYAPAGFSMKVMATDWGFKGTIDELCAKVKKEGYDGLELWWPTDPTKRDAVVKALNKYELEVGFLCGGSQKDPAEHLNTFKKSIQQASSFNGIRPVYINCHSGRDFFTYEQNKAFIDLTAEAATKTGIPVHHETHRGRMLFAAHITRNFIEKNPSLSLTLDISHWCNVHESLLTDQKETVDLALTRVGHIHARIGHTEGPQVNDPRAPEWEQTVNAHLAWWDAVVERKAREGKLITFLTEFGPPDYLPVLPYTRQPVADQWDINVHMLKLLRKRYAR